MPLLFDVVLFESCEYRFFIRFGSEYMPLLFESGEYRFFMHFGSEDVPVVMHFGEKVPEVFEVILLEPLKGFNFTEDVNFEA